MMVRLNTASLCLPWCVVLDNGVESIKLDLILANISIKHHTGMLKLITPQNLTRQVGGSHLQNQRVSYFLQEKLKKEVTF